MCPQRILVNAAAQLPAPHLLGEPQVEGEGSRRGADLLGDLATLGFARLGCHRAANVLSGLCGNQPVKNCSERLVKATTGAQ